MNEPFIYCITLHMPWAYWVMKGWKKIETREHNRFRCLGGKTILIHASKRWLAGSMINFLTNDQVEQTVREAEKLHGHILALATVWKHGPLTPEHTREAMIECRTKRFGSFLTDVRPLAKPIPISGRQGIWKVPRSLIPELCTNPIQK